MPAGGDKNVGWFDIAVYDALGVRRLKRVADLEREIEQFRNWYRLAGDAVPERLAFQELHHEKRPALIIAQIVNRADARMIQGRGGAGFALEPLERRWIGGEGPR